MSGEPETGSADRSEPSWAIFLISERSQSGRETLAGAATRGETVFHLALQDAETDEELVQAIAREFQVPHAIRGLDAALSVMADVDWLPNASGYLLMLEGISSLKAANESLFARLLLLLLNLCDRWRSRQVPFRVVVKADADVQLDIRSRLEGFEEEIEASPWVKDYQAVPIRSSIE